MLSLLRPIRQAFSFLTILPLCRPAEWRDGDGARVVLGFPLVGLTLGAILWVAAPWLANHLRPEAAAVALAALIVGLSGALHLDGLCDVADAALAAKTLEDRRRIARDPHLGVYGLAVGGFYLLALSAVCRPPLDPRALAFAPLIARTLVLPWLALPPLAEGSRFAAALRPTPSSLLAALALAFVLGLGLAWALAPWTARTLGVPLAAAALVSLTVGVIAVRRLGGISGDIAGAQIALVELAVLGVWA